MPKKTDKPTARQSRVQNYHIVELIESVKNDNLVQFGEIKKDFGAVESRLNDHHKRLKTLENDKVKRDAIEEYKKNNPEPRYKATNGSNGDTISLNRDLMKALSWLVLALGAVVAALVALKP